MSGHEYLEEHRNEDEETPTKGMRARGRIAAEQEGGGGLMQLLFEEHLGDGAYIGYDGYQVWLSAERNGAVHQVAMDPMVVLAFNRYMSQLPERVRAYQETNKEDEK